MKYIACCVLLFALGLIGFSAQAQDQDYPYQLALERIEEARQTHADSVALPADLTRLPPELFTLTDIKTLNLSYMHLTTFPPEIGQMTNLVALHMCCGDLQSIPPEIGQMTNLVQLTLQSNRLTSIPSEISNLKHLKQLALSGNGLKELPDSIWGMTSLEELWLDYNQFESIPTDIGQLKKLVILNLGGNRITALPAEIEQLTHLCWLDANSNQLKALPAGITRLINMTTGEGCFNRPYGMGNSKYGLQIWGNPMLYPENVLQGDAQTIFTYLDDQAAAEGQRILLMMSGAASLVTLIGMGIGWWRYRRAGKKKKRG